MAADPFDFTNTTDLPEELQKGLTSKRGGVGSAAFVDVLVKAKAAGKPPLTLAQLKAAAHRMGIKLPGDQTIRKYLDDAAKTGSVVKPTRQTYAAT